MSHELFDNVIKEIEMEISISNFLKKKLFLLIFVTVIISLNFYLHIIYGEMNS